ncbi:hypothetical protein SAMN05216233_14013, partial [Desulfoluna spongiiphila]
FYTIIYFSTKVVSSMNIVYIKKTMY